jgi:hypothetical protein
MLINEIGTEVDVVRLESRRNVVIPDPKNRVTMTMLLHEAMVTATRPERVTPRTPPSPPITALSAPADDSSQRETSPRSDAA